MSTLQKKDDEKHDVKQILPYPNYKDDSDCYIDLNQHGNALLAKGAFGEVSLGIDKGDSSSNIHTPLHFVAIKTIPNAFISPNTNKFNSTSWDFASSNLSASSPEVETQPEYQLAKEVFCEITALRLLTNINKITPTDSTYKQGRTYITPLLSVFPTPSNSSTTSHFYNYLPSTSISLVFPFCPASLFDILLLRKYSFDKHYLEWKHLKLLFQDMICAIHHCHSHGILHRDIKPGNFLLSFNGVCQLTDFGLAKPISTPNNHVDEEKEEHALGTIQYLSPELLYGSKKHYFPSVDIFALGLVFIECISNHIFINGKNILDQLSKTVQMVGTPGRPDLWPEAKSLPDFQKVGFPPHEPKDFSTLIPRLKEGENGMTSLLAQMLQCDPRKRPSAKEILRHDWFQSQTSFLKVCNDKELRKRFMSELIHPSWYEPIPLDDRDVKNVSKVKKNALEMLKQRRKFMESFEGEWGNGYMQTTTTGGLNLEKKSNDQNKLFGRQHRPSGLLNALSKHDL